MSEYSQSLNQAIELHKTGNLKKAKAMYMKILSDYPNQPEANHMLGVIAYQEKEYELSIELISKAIEMESSNPSYYVSLGMVYEEKGDFNEAENSYLQALNRTELKYGHEYSPSKFYKDNKFESALKKIKLKANTQELNKIHLGLGNIFISKGQFGKALEELLQVIETDLNEDFLQTFYLQMAKCFYALNQPAEGIAYFEKSTTCPSSLDSYKEMEDFLIQNKLFDFTEGIKQAKDYNGKNKQILD